MQKYINNLKVNPTFITALHFSVFKLSRNPWGADGRPLNPFSRTVPEFIARSINKTLPSASRVALLVELQDGRRFALRGSGSCREQPPARPQVLGSRELLHPRTHPFRHWSSRVQLIGRVCSIDDSRSDRAHFYALEYVSTPQQTGAARAGQRIALGGIYPPPPSFAPDTSKSRRVLIPFFPLPPLSLRRLFPRHLHQTKSDGRHRGGRVVSRKKM